MHRLADTMCIMLTCMASCTGQWVSGARVNAQVALLRDSVFGLD